MKDVIIIGAGPSGISAALYLKRLNRDILVIYKDEGSLKSAHKIENYYGAPSITGTDLFNIGLKQAKDLEIEIINDEVLTITKYDNFQVKTVNGIYESKTVLLATGAERNTYIKGSKELMGQGVSACVMCDGFFYRNKKVAIIGDSYYMLEELEALRNFTKDITIYTNGTLIDKPGNYEKIIELIKKDDKIIIKTNNTNESFDGVFLAIGTPKAQAFALTLGLGMNDSYLVVDENKMTNMEGLFAAGDTTGGMLQVAKATYDGAIAGNAIHKYLKEHE